MKKKTYEPKSVRTIKSVCFEALTKPEKMNFVPPKNTEEWIEQVFKIYPLS